MLNYLKDKDDKIVKDLNKFETANKKGRPGMRIPRPSNLKKRECLVFTKSRSSKRINNDNTTIVGYYCNAGLRTYC